ncbi:amino acid permease [Alicyclobacillus acidoterrestris]|uniref:amino acid permease n=1 Tax=Alicyclobacillus suci TaxID=2816080 RepID=UPI0011928D54|nr:amino acid permease [Alicyclobacillus suci]GEO25754.1 amino acid permease [Alicyclobacillus acidoterrestris]
MQKTTSLRTTPRQKTMGMPVQAKATMRLAELILVGVGGIIGAGFFLGSGLPIRTAGPAVMISFLMGGLITAQVVGALSSVAMDHPVEGAFKVYADMYLGRFLGYMQGWTYYLTSILTIASEAVASAIFVRVWLPGAPLWALSSGFAAMIILMNAFGVANFGRIESLMSVIKIAALVGFAAVILLMLFGVRPHTLTIPVTMSTGGGFFAHGVGGIFQSMLIVIFSFAGIGVFATAAVELKHPKKLDTGAIVTITCLTVLYLLSIGTMLLVLPYERVSTNISPFVQALRYIHMNILANVLNAVILVAAFSVMAGAVFSANQILASLGQSGEAPRLTTRTSKQRHVQYGALLFTAFGIAIFLTLSYVLPSSVYNFLVSASSFLTFFNYFIMLATFLAWRRQSRHKPVSRLAFGQPVATVLTMAVVVFLAGYALFQREQRLGFYACLGMTAFISMGYFFTHKFQRHRLEQN